MKKYFFSFALLLSLSASAQVRFDTRFESGSAGNITQIDSAYIRTSEKDSILHLSYIVESRFDPPNPVDTALVPSARWFYFRMTGTKNKYIYLDFKNTDPLRAVYSYDNEAFKRFESNEAKLGKVSKLFEHDTVYISYFIPYTNEYLNKRIKTWQQHSDVEVTNFGFIPRKTPVRHSIVEGINFGYSYSYIPMKCLTITDKSVSDKNKRTIWIQARTHTSETPSSWHLDGMIDALLANTEEARQYRKSFIFYIVPFVNPDGVFEGRSRSNSHGVNLEINWGRDDEQTSYEVKKLKDQIRKVSENKPLDMFLNMHSQVANNATYWVHNAKSTNEKFLKQQLLLCYLNMFDNNYLTPDELSFSSNAPRYPEGWIWNNNKDQTIAITFETPYTYYGDRNIWLDTENLRDFGKATLNAIAMYFGVCSDDRIILQNENAKTKGKWIKNTQDTMMFFGKNYLLAQKTGSKITYRYKKLATGNYKIYKWAVGKSSETPVTNANKWIFAGNHEQKKTSAFKYTVKAHENELCDAVMLIRTMD